MISKCPMKEREEILGGGFRGPGQGARDPSPCRGVRVARSLEVQAERTGLGGLNKACQVWTQPYRLSL